MQKHFKKITVPSLLFWMRIRGTTQTWDWHHTARREDSSIVHFKRLGSRHIHKEIEIS